MPKRNRPRHGSLQYWPRKRTRRIYPKIRAWLEKEDTKLLGFAGYKAGMTHILAIDQNPHALSKGDKVMYPVTIIECPPLKPLSLRFYKKTDSGLNATTEIFSPKLDKELIRKTNLAKKPKTDLKDVESKLNEFDDLRLVVYTQPKLTNVGKKKPEIFEIAISGKTLNEKFNYAKNLLDKEIKISDVFQSGQIIDIHAVTKGKGFQGVIKRFGVSLKQKKSEKKKRSAILGSWTPKRVSWKVPHTGQMGYYTRTEFNKIIFAIKSDPKEINKKGGFTSYGVIKNDYLLIKGSVPGARKRLIRFAEAIRPTKQHPVEISYISLKK